MLRRSLFLFAAAATTGAATIKAQQMYTRPSADSAVVSSYTSSPSSSLFPNASANTVVNSVANKSGAMLRGLIRLAVPSTAHASGTNWKAVKADVEALLQKENCGPLLVRLSWHAAGTYSKKDNTGGCGATMRFAPESDHGANAGLGLARDMLEPIKQKHPEVSYSDLWAFAAVVAIEAMGGPHINFRPGRADLDAKRCTPDGRLPDADKNSNHIRDIFYRMGFNDQEIVALIGAHTMGECHKDRSGYVGPWTRDPYGFSNSFFVELLNNRWEVKPGSVPEQYQDAATKQLMMLPADMAFLSDPDFRRWVEIYARDGDRFNADFAAAFQKLQEAGVPSGRLSLFPVSY